MCPHVHTSLIRHIGKIWVISLMRLPLWILLKSTDILMLMGVIFVVPKHIMVKEVIIWERISMFYLIPMGGRLKEKAAREPQL